MFLEVRIGERVDRVCERGLCGRALRDWIARVVDIALRGAGASSRGGEGDSRVAAELEPTLFPMVPISHRELQNAARQDSDDEPGLLGISHFRRLPARRERAEMSIGQRDAACVCFE